MALTCICLCWLIIVSQSLAIVDPAVGHGMFCYLSLVLFTVTMYDLRCPWPDRKELSQAKNSRPVTRCEAVGRPKGSVDPEGVPTTGARGCPPENFFEIQL